MKIHTFPPIVATLLIGVLEIMIIKAVLKKEDAFWNEMKYEFTVDEIDRYMILKGELG